MRIVGKDTINLIIDRGVSRLKVGIVSSLWRSQRSNVKESMAADLKMESNSNMSREQMLIRNDKVICSVVCELFAVYDRPRVKSATVSVPSALSGCYGSQPCRSRIACPHERLRTIWLPCP